MKIPRILLVALGSAAHAVEPVGPVKNAAYQGSVSEEQLRVATDRVKQEMAGLIEEYARYTAAAGEVEILKEAVGTLDGVAAKDMSGVVKGLMEASRSDDPKILVEELRKANRSQKDIQITLRELADKLTRRAAAAALQKRLEDIAVRQAAVHSTTMKMAGKASAPKDLPDHRQKQELGDKRAEQNALEKEIRLAQEEMRKVAKNPDEEAAKPASEALAAAQDRQLEEKSKQATAAMDSDLPRAAQVQQEMMDTLKSMIASLDAAKTPEERSRELAGELAELARKEKALASRTPKAQEWEQTRNAREQEEITSRLEVMKDRVARQNPEAGARAAEAAAKSGEISKELRTEKFNENADRVANTSDAQKNLAKELGAMGEALQKQADSLAGNQSSEPGEGETPSPEQTAIQEAVNELMEAQADLDLARLQDKQGQDSKGRIGQAQQKINHARDRMKDAGKTIGDWPDQKLVEAQASAQKAGQGEQVEHHLYHTRAKVGEAIGSLQNAANQMAARDRDSHGSNQKGGIATGSNIGKLRGNGDAQYSALGDKGEAQREALSMLKQDKVAPEYEPMVNQYIKNLAEEQEEGR